MSLHQSLRLRYVITDPEIQQSKEPSESRHVKCHFYEVCNFRVSEFIECRWCFAVRAGTCSRE